MLIFWLLAETLMFVVGYNKTDNLTFSQKKVARFLHPQHALLLFTFLSYIKPVEQRFLLLLGLNQEPVTEPGAEPEGAQQPQQEQQQPTTTTYHFLFTRRGKRYPDAQIPQTFHRVMVAEAGLAILFRDYRDAAVALFRERRKTEDCLDEVVALQTGHSEEEAAKTYGRDGKEDLRHSATLEYNFLRVSVAWQTFIFQRFASFFFFFSCLVFVCCLFVWV